MKQLFFAALLLVATVTASASAGSSTQSNNICVSGTVIDANTKKPLADVTVVAVNGTTKETVVSNANGQFRIASLPTGTYTIRLLKDDYRNYEKKEVQVKADNTTKLTVEMVAETMETTSHRTWWDKYDLYL